MKFKSIVTNRIVTNGFLLTASSSAFMPVIMAKEDHDPKIVRPRDLPIYPEESEVKKSDNESNWEPTIAIGAIQKVREEIVNLNNKLSKVNNRVYTFVQTGISHSESFVDDLRQEKNGMLRTGFVAGGGLVGLLVAVKKGKFKKLIYTTAGVSTACYIAFPKESEEATKVIKRYSIVSYHFINNVSKDLTGYELPPLPAPKGELEVDNSGGNKPDVKELLYSLMEYIKKPMESLKAIILNEKDKPDDKSK